ncbi:MAG: sugar kinase [Armatimonadota bacterium]
MGRVVSMGEALVEIMRKTVDSPLYAADDFVGPFPSGAPAIFIDQVARLGHDASFIGAVGADDFGKCLLDRFRADDVDASYVAEVEGLATGCAFVTYFSDGERQFIFHIGNSAAGQLPEITAEMFEDADWLHICGSTLSAGEEMMQACYRACGLAADAGARISFDPNLRPELLGGEEALRRVCAPVVNAASLILPSSTEAELLTDTEDAHTACRQLLERGADVVALKRGSEGCTIFTDTDEVSVGAYNVDAVDPTGAGDSFDAACVVGLMEDLSLQQIGRLANACGALGATKKGPMEGCAMRDDAFELAGLDQ